MVLFVQCVVCCLLFSLLILPGLYRDPLNMIMSYPPAIIKRVESLPQYRDTIKRREKEHISKKIVGLIVFVFVMAAIAYFSNCRSFSSAFIRVFILFMTVNLYDLIVLDWGIFCHSKKLKIPGTENMEKEYSDPWFHLRGFFIGCVLGLIVAIMSGVVIHMVNLF